MSSYLCRPVWNVCSRDFTFFPKEKILFPIKLFIWYFWETLFWRTTEMGGLGVSLRKHECILLVFFLLQIQGLGLDMDSHPTAEVCATHTISPGPKGKERKGKFSSLVSRLSSFSSQPHSSSRWLSLLPSLLPPTLHLFWKTNCLIFNFPLMLGKRILGGGEPQGKDVMELIQGRRKFPLLCCSRKRHTSKALVFRNPFLKSPAPCSYWFC